MENVRRKKDTNAKESTCSFICCCLKQHNAQSYQKIPAEWNVYEHMILWIFERNLKKIVSKLLDIFALKMVACSQTFMQCIFKLDYVDTNKNTHTLHAIIQRKFEITRCRAKEEIIIQTMAKFTTGISDCFASGPLHTVDAIIVIINAYVLRTRIATCISTVVQQNDGQMKEVLIAVNSLCHLK